MKARLILSFCVMVALVAPGFASATVPAGSSNDYLVLGDSIAFAFIDQAGYEYYYPINFVGYADWTGLASNLNPVNAACPGETSGSFLSSTAPDNGCRLYRSYFPLHVVYGSVRSTQLTFATSFLQLHSDTSLVTIAIGVNDLLLLEQQCNNDPTCIANGAPQVFATAGANMQKILAALRATGYAGAIVIPNYYSLDYSNQFETQLIAGLNQAITAPAPAYGAVVANVFSAFQAAASNPFAAGNTCVAGLLNASNPPTDPSSCDIHPSQAGHKLMAQVVVGESPSHRK